MEQNQVKTNKKNMNNIRYLFKLNFIDFVKKSLFLFIKFYVAFLLVVSILEGLNIFSIILPLIVYFAFLFLNTRLKSLVLLEKEDGNYIQINLTSFIFKNQKKESLIDTISYSYKEEMTSRLTRGNVFRIYFKNYLILKRHHELDGMNEKDVLRIIKEFKRLKINSVED